MVLMPYRYWKFTVVRIHIRVPTLTNMATPPAMPPPAAFLAASLRVSPSGFFSAGAATIKERCAP